MHAILSTLLIHIADFFIVWARWHDLKVVRPKLTHEDLMSLQRAYNTMLRDLLDEGPISVHKPVVYQPTRKNRNVH